MTTPPKKTSKEILAEIRAEGYDPDWRRKIAIEIYERTGRIFPSQELVEEVLKRERGEQSEA